MSAAVIALLCVFAALTSCGSQTEDSNTGNNNSDDSPIVYGIPGIGVGKPEVEAAEVFDSNGFIICVDPGHGFMDGGTGENILPNGILEKDITLAMSKKLGAELTRLGYTVIMTHDGVNRPEDARYDDIFNATERTNFANSIEMDYFISLHVNAIEGKPDICGSHIYFMQSWAKINDSGELIAELIGESIEKALPDDPKPLVVDQNQQDTSFALVRDVKYPSSLVEIGFCTNESDAKNMVRDDWQETFACAVAAGINEYFTKYSDNR